MTLPDVLKECGDSALRVNPTFRELTGFFWSVADLLRGD